MVSQKVHSVVKPKNHEIRFRVVSRIRERLISVPLMNERAT